MIYEMMDGYLYPAGSALEQIDADMITEKSAPKLYFMDLKLIGAENLKAGDKIIKLGSWNKNTIVYTVN